LSGAWHSLQVPSQLRGEIPVRALQLTEIRVVAPEETDEQGRARLALAARIRPHPLAVEGRRRTRRVDQARIRFPRAENCIVTMRLLFGSTQNVSSLAA
jgi:hypothetical protein